MSFGFSPSDIVALVNITSKAYQGWKHACGEYSEVTGSLDSLLIVLHRIETEASKPNSVLLRTTNDEHDLKDIFSNCEPTVRELHSIVTRYKSLGTSREKNWDKLRFGVKNLDPLRVKLAQHIATIAAYLDAVGLGALGRIERDINSLPRRILAPIEALVADIRAGRREGSIMTTYSDDEKDVWKQFRRELIGDGLRSSVIHKYKPLIRKYLKELAERGELEELPPDGEILAESDRSSFTATEVPEKFSWGNSIICVGNDPPDIITSKQAPIEGADATQKTEDLRNARMWVHVNEEGVLDVQCLSEGWTPRNILRSHPPEQLSWSNIENGDEIQLRNSGVGDVEFLYFSFSGIPGGDITKVDMGDHTKTDRLQISSQEEVKAQRVPSTHLNWETTSGSESSVIEDVTTLSGDILSSTYLGAESKIHSVWTDESEVPDANIETPSADAVTAGRFISSDGEDESTYDPTRGEVKKYKNGEEIVWHYPHKIKRQHANGMISTVRRLKIPTKQATIDDGVRDQNASKQSRIHDANLSSDGSDVEADRIHLATAASIMNTDQEKLNHGDHTIVTEETSSQAPGEWKQNSSPSVRAVSNPNSHGNPPSWSGKSMIEQLMGTQSDSDISQRRQVRFNDLEASDTVAHAGRARRRRKRVYPESSRKVKDSPSNIARAGAVGVIAALTLAGMRRAKDRERENNDDYSD